MRIAAWALLLLGLLLLIGCADDSPPTFVGQKEATPLVNQIDQVGQVDQVQEAVTVPTSDVRDRSELEPETKPGPQTNRNLIMRLVGDVDVFQWPGDDWMPVSSYGPGTLLLADGWARQDNGAIWLRLDLNQDRVGWVRLEESPLSVAEAQSLPMRSQPPLPNAQLRGSNGGVLTVSLLGRFTDERSAVVRFGSSGPALRVKPSVLESVHNLERLPVYAGVVMGQWQPIHEEVAGLEVEVWHWNSFISAWPTGPALSYRLRWGRYPVLGRSLDSMWIALRIDSLDPPAIWLSADSLTLEFEPVDLPIFLSAGIEVVTLDSEGRAVSSIFADEPGSYWEWRNAEELMLSDLEVGTWFWDPERNAVRELSEHRLANISPDGAYAVRRFQSGQTTPIDWQTPWNVALVSLQDGAETTFEAVYRPWGTDAPGFQQFWSADSQWLFSTVSRIGEPDGQTQHFALSVTGELVEIVAPEGEWVVHWGVLQAVEQAGGNVRYFKSDGEEIARPWGDEVFDADRLPPTEYPELPEGWWPQEWSPDGRLLIATRRQWTDQFDPQGVAALSRMQSEGWGTYEIGVFDQAGKLRQVFRGFGGLDCAQLRSNATWSPDGSRILFGPRFGAAPSAADDSDRVGLPSTMNSYARHCGLTDWGLLDGFD